MFRTQVLLVRYQQVGRPIEFTGDIDSPELTDGERRRLKRCALCPEHLHYFVAPHAQPRSA